FLIVEEQAGNPDRLQTPLPGARLQIEGGQHALVKNKKRVAALDTRTFAARRHRAAHHVVSQRAFPELLVVLVEHDGRLVGTDDVFIASRATTRCSSKCVENCTKPSPSGIKTKSFAGTLAVSAAAGFRSAVPFISASARS